jgi:plastocyanin
MTRIRLALAAGVVAALAAAPTTGGATPPKLLGTVGPNFTITLTKGGKKLTKLKAGTYTLVVRDRSEFHNFHLTGPGVNRKTLVDGTGTRTWTVRLKKGRYTYVCDPHRVDMRGSFQVTA